MPCQHSNIVTFSLILLICSVFQILLIEDNNYENQTAAELSHMWTTRILLTDEHSVIDTAFCIKSGSTL